LINHHYVIGMSPSGKATGFDPVIRRFDPCHPSHIF
jgi:ribose-phosphate pyrophosphokinase